VFVLTATDGSYVETTAPTSYDQVASGSWEMYGVVYNAADGDLELSGVTDPATTFDVSTAVFVDSFSVAAQDTTPVDLAFNNDGTKMFVLGTADQDVNEYTLSTGFDVSTASFTHSFSVAAQETAPRGIAFNADGTKMFVVGQTGDDVNEYTLSTGFDISTASFVDSFNVSAQDGVPQGIAFSTDGNKMFVVGNQNDSVYEYTLSTNFDVSTASFVDSFSVSAQETSPQGLAFNTAGTKMFICGLTGVDVNEYTLSTGFDVSTATFVDSFSVSAQESSPYGLVFNTSGTKMFIVGTGGDDVNEYNVGATSTPTGYHPVHTTQSIDSTYWTDINSMTADQAAGDGNVYYAISTDDRTTWTVIDNTDGERDIVRNNAGTWQYNSNGTYASETWVNGATNTELATLAEAMEGAAATVGYALNNASYDSVSFNLSSQDTDVFGMAFSSDGTKMFIMGENSDDVYQYSLSTAWDLSTASYDSVSFNVGSQEAFGIGIAFSSDGTKMYLVGILSDTVYQYSLSTAWDLSSASYASKSFDVSSQDTYPYNLQFNATGTKMYLAGSTSSSIYQYTLSTAWDISTASYDSVSFSTSSQGGSPSAIAFNLDGSKIFIVSVGADKIFQYSLSTAYDLSSISYDSISFSLSLQEGNAYGLVFGNNGTKMFVSGNTDFVYQYSASTTSYTNQMDKTQLDAVTDPNHIALGDDLDLSIIFNMTSGTTVPSSDGVAINYDANVLNKGAVLGTDYDFDAPAGNAVRVTALTAGNFKVRVV
jgi:sugar lactone lactonase YvrE